MSKRRILITEDERITALDLKMALTDLDYEVVGTADTGEDAIIAAKELKPDLVVMDIHLKTDMLGTEAAAKIVEEHAIPVIFLSAYSDKNIVDEAGKAQAYGYLIKPYEKRELDAAIRVAFAKHSTDEELRRSDERLRMALDAAKMSIWEWDPTGDMVADGKPPADKGVFSQSLDKLVEKVHPDDRSIIYDNLKASSRIHCQIRMRFEEGADYDHAEVFAAVFEWNDGSRRVIGVVRDVEDDFRAQEKLRQARAVFESTSEGILITDKYRKVTAANPAFFDITGFSLDDIIGRDPDEFLHARRHSDHFYPRLTEKGSHHWNGEIGCNKKAGGRFPAWEHISGVFDDQGQLSNYVFTISDIGELRRAEKSLARMAFLDALTGVGNRVHLERTLKEALSRREETGEQVAVLYIDLDGFKAINDTLGHAEGDRMLQQVAERFVTSVRDDDIVTRVGGDEFVIVVPSVDDEEGLKVMASKLLRSVSSPMTLAREVVEVSASIGIAISSNSLSTHEELITAADTALFHAKHMGKNCYYFYDFKLAMESGEKLRIERNMKGALNNQEICVEFQPLIDLKNHRIYGAEALCRWYSHDLGVIPPERFIPIAEQSNMILELGAQVLDESCKALRSWINSGYKDMVVSVNVSARQLNDKRFPDIVRDTLIRHDVPASGIELEITETAIQNNDRAREQLEILGKLGLRFAIDDFGTGYSSLSRLKTLPFDRVKIDRSFVTDLPDSESDTEICRAIFALCNVLKLSVTAEGVENERQLSILKEMGCGCVQGFYFSRSMPAQGFLTWANDYNAKAG